MKKKKKSPSVVFYNYYVCRLTQKTLEVGEQSCERCKLYRV